MVESDSRIRRTNRLKGKHKGYKGESCPNKDCFVCISTSPTLSTKVIRNLGETFGKIAPEELSEDVLTKKKVPNSKSVASEAIGESSGSAKAGPSQTKRDRVKVKVFALKKKDQHDRKPKKKPKQ